MAFDWNNYLTLAEELATRPGDEAAKRTAISRAYYCVFNLAFARAELSAGPYPLRWGYHSWCWTKYKSTPDTRCRQLGNVGDRMKRRRVQADYESADISRLDHQVQLMLDEARQFCTDLAALTPGYPSP
jgi:hypothetical protein